MWSVRGNSTFFSTDDSHGVKMSHHPRNHEDINVSGRLETWVFLTDTRSPKPQAGKWHKPHLQLHKPKHNSRSQVDPAHINRTEVLLPLSCLRFLSSLDLFCFRFLPKAQTLLSFRCTVSLGRAKATLLCLVKLKPALLCSSLGAGAPHLSTLCKSWTVSPKCLKFKSSPGGQNRTLCSARFNLLFCTMYIYRAAQNINNKSQSPKAMHKQAACFQQPATSRGPDNGLSPSCGGQTILNHLYIPFMWSHLRGLISF